MLKKRAENIYSAAAAPTVLDLNHHFLHKTLKHVFYKLVYYFSRTHTQVSVRLEK